MAYLVLTNDKEVWRLRCDKIVYVEADTNFSSIYMSTSKEDKTRIYVTIQLGQIEKKLSELFAIEREACFIRIGRSLLVNKSYIYYINPAQKKLILIDEHDKKYNLEASVEALHKLKAFVEEEYIQ